MKIWGKDFHSTKFCSVYCIQISVWPPSWDPDGLTWTTPLAALDTGLQKSNALGRMAANMTVVRLTSSACKCGIKREIAAVLVNCFNRVNVAGPRCVADVVIEVLLDGSKTS